MSLVIVSIPERRAPLYWIFNFEKKPDGPESCYFVEDIQ